ncbi:hypothetical protein CSA56_13350 [candidate division KSB3 bacterium]|uniref:DUF6444 domain-containing protein n=1 Tax=candidate division KSB3 bacterium TaxID=2044937 RepID=A0A2G6KBM7_9BACT|nr:MAG: hypothetical protein CSA56_13350 [candidate division KSB3 bacterium]
MCQLSVHTAAPKLEELVQTLLEENQRLHHRITELESKLAQTRKNSRTSSKPPSSDMVKPLKTSKQPKTSGCRKAEGHPTKHERAAFILEQLDQRHEYTVDNCPSALEATEKVPRIIQQGEIQKIPFTLKSIAVMCIGVPSVEPYSMRPCPLMVVSKAACSARN